MPFINPFCLERNPDCTDGNYDVLCCRWPKSCSCTLVNYHLEGVFAIKFEIRYPFWQYYDQQNYVLLRGFNEIDSVWRCVIEHWCNNREEALDFINGYFTTLALNGVVSGKVG